MLKKYLRGKLLVLNFIFSKIFVKMLKTCLIKFINSHNDRRDDFYCFLISCIA